MARWVVLTLAAVCLSFAVGCRRATPEPPTPSSIPVPSSSPVETAAPPAVQPTPTPPAPVPSSTPTQDPAGVIGVEHEGGELGEVWSLADVRYAEHEDRARLVLEMVEAGEHTPYFTIVEVDNAASPFPLDPDDPAWGVARIDLIVSDLYGYDFPFSEVLPIIPPADSPVTRIALYPTFSDSHLGFSIGLRAPAAYQVGELTDPVRIVIDVLYAEPDGHDAASP